MEETTIQQTTPVITEQGQANLKSACGWATFLSVMGFFYVIMIGAIGVGIIAFSSIFEESFFPGFPGNVPMTMPMNIIGIVYIIMALIYLFPSIYLYIFGDKTKSALTTGNQEDFDRGLKNLKSMFKFIGIITIISLAILMLIIPLFFVFAMTVGAM